MNFLSRTLVLSTSLCLLSSLEASTNFGDFSPDIKISEKDSAHLIKNVYEQALCQDTMSLLDDDDPENPLSSLTNTLSSFTKALHNTFKHPNGHSFSAISTSRNLLFMTPPVKSLFPTSLDLYLYGNLNKILNYPVLPNLSYLNLDTSETSLDNIKLIDKDVALAISKAYYKLYIKPNREQIALDLNLAKKNLESESSDLTESSLLKALLRNNDGKNSIYFGTILPATKKDVVIIDKKLSSFNTTIPTLQAYILKANEYLYNLQTTKFFSTGIGSRLTHAIMSEAIKVASSIIPLDSKSLESPILKPDITKEIIFHIKNSYSFNKKLNFDNFVFEKNFSEIVDDKGQNIMVKYLLAKNKTLNDGED